MGRNWSKQRSRDATSRTRRAEMDQTRYLSELEAPTVQPSKAELRAEAADALARYDGPIRRVPTWIDLKCYQCNHKGRIRIYLGEHKRFKCSKCGARSF